MAKWLDDELPIRVILKGANQGNLKGSHDDYVLGCGPGCARTLIAFQHGPNMKKRDTLATVVVE